MMTSSNGNIFRVTCHLCGEFTGDRWIPCTKASDAELWCFFLSERLSKQSWGWWFETPSRPFWCQINGIWLRKCIHLPARPNEPCKIGPCTIVTTWYVVYDSRGTNWLTNWSLMWKLICHVPYNPLSDTGCQLKYHDYVMDYFNQPASVHNFCDHYQATVMYWDNEIRW